MRVRCRLIWDPYLGEVLLISPYVALSVTGDRSRDVMAVNTQGRGITSAIVKGITEKNGIKLEKQNENCLRRTSQQHSSLGSWKATVCSAI